jgi:DNA-binding MarR family transcriptional regulator
MPTQHFRAETFLGRNSPGYLLKRAHGALVDWLEPVIEARGLTFTQYVVLMYLREGLVISASTLCVQLRHDSGALTRIIDQLEARDLVRRERSRTDRRSVLLQLTDTGRATVEEMIPAVVNQLNTALGAFSRSELTELMRLLSKLIVVVEAAAAELAPSAEERP